MSKRKKEWVNEYKLEYKLKNYKLKNVDAWIESSRHTTEKAADKAATRCALDCGSKHRVRKLTKKELAND